MFRQQVEVANVEHVCRFSNFWKRVMYMAHRLLDYVYR